MARVPARALRAGEPERACLRRRRAPDRTRADDLAAVRRRDDLLAPRPRTGASASSTSARGRATRRPCSPSSLRRWSRSSASPSSPSAATHDSRRRRVRERRGQRRRRLARRARARAVRRDRGRGGGSERSLRRSTTSSPKAAVSSFRAARGSGQELVLVARTPDGPTERTSIPCRFVPLVGDEGFGDD